MDYSKIIILIREKLFLPQEELAKKFDITPVTISRWECGISTPKMSKKRKYLNFCKKNDTSFKET